MNKPNNLDLHCLSAITRIWLREARCEETALTAKKFWDHPNIIIWIKEWIQLWLIREHEQQKHWNQLITYSLTEAWDQVLEKILNILNQ